jgi:hypothetical protein
MPAILYCPSVQPGTHGCQRTQAIDEPIQRLLLTEQKHHGLPLQTNTVRIWGSLGQTYSRLSIESQ